jgi:hypothetical protein
VFPLEEVIHTCLSVASYHLRSLVRSPFGKRIVGIAPGNIGMSMDQVELKKLLVL